MGQTFWTEFILKSITVSECLSQLDITIHAVPIAFSSRRKLLPVHSNGKENGQLKDVNLKLLILAIDLFVSTLTLIVLVTESHSFLFSSM